MARPNWFVLTVDDDEDILLRCTPDDWTKVPMRPADPRAGRPLDRAQTNDARDAVRFAPTGTAAPVTDKDPRATHVVNDLATEDAATQQHLRRLGHAVQEAMAPFDDAPLYVAMGPSRAALFEAVGRVPVAGQLEPQLRSRDLWRVSKQAIVA